MNDEVKRLFLPLSHDLHHLFTLPPVLAAISIRRILLLFIFLNTDMKIQYIEYFTIYVYESSQPASVGNFHLDIIDRLNNILPFPFFFS